MNRFALAISVALVFLGLTGTSRAVTLALLPVGDPGNAVDGRPGAHLGAVNYRYWLDKNDVTNAQYVEFLNAKASVADPYGLYDTDMAEEVWQGGIVRSGAAAYVYAVKPGMANMPVVNVSWFDAIRFANWLTNGQGNGDTESGTYSITAGGFDSGVATVPTAAERAAWVGESLHYMLPSADEWYKAAYYKGSGANAGYWNYPFASNSPPLSGPPGTFHGANVASFPNTAVPGPIYLTDVGAYNYPSPYGQMDLGGNVYQWTDSPYIGNPTRMDVRGSSWSGDAGGTFFQSSSNYPPELASYEGGFRIAMVPEPGSLTLGALAALGLFAWRYGKLARRR